MFPEFLVSLCYMPTSGRLTFVALKGKNLDFDITVVSGKNGLNIYSLSINHTFP